MPIKLELFSNQDLTFFTADGEISFSEASEIISSYYKGIDPRPTKNIIWDLRNASVASLSPYQITCLADLSAKYSELRDGGKTAIVASHDINFGIARVFEAETMDVPREFVVFRDMDQALRWINE